MGKPLRERPWYPRQCNFAWDRGWIYRGPDKAPKRHWSWVLLIFFGLGAGYTKGRTLTVAWRAKEHWQGHPRWLRITGAREHAFLVHFGRRNRCVVPRGAGCWKTWHVWGWPKGWGNPHRPWRG